MVFSEILETIEGDFISVCPSNCQGKKKNGCLACGPLNLTLQEAQRLRSMLGHRIIELRQLQEKKKGATS